MTDTVDQLRAMRDRYGADSPVHHRCENLRHMFDSYGAAAGDLKRQAKLEQSIRRQWSDLVGLTGGL
jgi:hypothetical protein